MTQTSHSSQKIPKLRFREFQGEWETKELGDITLRMQSWISRSLSNYDIGYPILRSNNIQNWKVNINDIKYWHFIDDQGADLTKYILEQGDILVNFINSIAQIWKSAIFKNLLWRDIIYTTNVLRVSIKDADTSFVFYNFNTEQYNEYIQSITKPAVNQASFTTKEFKKYPIICPSLPEQTKIASFLSSVDTRIEQLREKKSLLEEYKKWVMQKIFAREIRFKDENGEEYGEWVEKKLGDLCKIKTGKKDVNEWNPDGQYPFFTCAKTHTYSDFYSFDCDAILIAWNGEVWHCQRYSGKFEAYQRTYVLSDFSEDIDYLYCHLNSTFQDVISSQKQMGAMPYIKLGMLTDFMIPIPSLPEQQKIASFLSEIDLKIQSTTEQLEEALKWKNGLLQGMFI